MSTRRLSFIFLLFATIIVSANQAEAGFCDWLFGRTANPYAAGYTPYTATYAQPTAGYAQPAAGYSPYAAGYAPAAPISPLPTVTTAAPQQGTIAVAGSYPAQTYPAPTYQAQMQTYDNRSVYSGNPVVMAPGAPQTAYRLPTSGTAAPLGSPITIGGTATTGSTLAPSGLTPAGSSMIQSGVTLQPNMNTAYRPFLGAAAARQPVLPPATTLPAPAFGTPNIGLGRSLPFAGRNTGGEVPLAGVLRGANTASNPFYGTGNIYPNNLAATAQPYRVGYGSNQPAVITTSPQAGVQTVAPSVDPLFPNAPRPRLGGLARFFSSMLGTNYTSSYYRAPVTYYRPITTVDPVSGTTVTVQQPCSSYVQQLQRTPYNSFQGGGLLGGPGTTVTPIGPLTPSTSNCQNVATIQQPAIGQPAYGPSPYGANPFAQGGAASNPNIIGQVGGTTSPSDYNVTPIPSTAPSSGYIQQNTAPLTGPRNGAATNDRQNVPQPRLESARPDVDNDSYYDGLFRDDVTPDVDEDSGNVEQSSFWDSRRYNMPELNAPTSSTIQSPRQTQLEPLLPEPNGLDADDSTPRFSTLRPIQAPESYQNPFPRHRTDQTERSEPVFSAPELPQASAPSMWQDRFDSGNGEANNASARISVPVREATLSRQRERDSQPRYIAPKPVQRDSSGWLPL
ncbi:MAG: hypothetical protein HKN47_06640 [Pirellulaceae bacterium]|nr:hypothetical protein [Pirellulaceae bacterium]